MRFLKKHLYLLILALALLAVCVVFLIYDNATSTDVWNAVCFYDSKHGIKLEPYYDAETEKYYLFLPSHISKNDISVKHKENMKLSFSSNGEVAIENFSDLPLSTDIVVTVEGAMQKKKSTIQILQCENLPTVYIETESGTMDTININRNEEDAAVVIIDTDGTLKHTEVAEISVAGNSTSHQAKKPYNIKFNKPVELFGIAEVQQWRLMANYADASMLRNYICYNTANDMGIAYTSAMEYVSVFLNGEYNGVYSLCTKYKYENDTDNLLAVFEKSDYDREYDYVSVQNGESTYITFQYGNSELVRSAVDLFNNALYGVSSFEEISKCIDVYSFAKKYLIEEILANCDNRLSQYFAIDTQGKITAICAWDYDLSLGISLSANVDIPYNSSVISKSWYKALFGFSEFRELIISLAKEYSSAFVNAFSDKELYVCESLKNDWALNNLRWGAHQPFGNGVTRLKHSPELTTLEEHISYIDNFICNRYSFLMDYWNNSSSFNSVLFKSDDGVRAYYPHGMSLKSASLPDGVLGMYENAEGFAGWYNENGVSLLDVDVINEDMVFYAKFEGEDNTAETDNIVVKMIKWPMVNFGIRNTAVIIGFGTVFLVAIVVGMHSSRRRRVKNE